MAASMTRCRIRILAKRLCNRQILRLLSTTKNEKFQADDNSPEKKTHFGFETVTEAEKEEKVYSVFKNVAEKYDLMNDAMSMGIHRLWKDHFIRRLAPRPGTKLIDVAGGTGDIAFRFLKYANSQNKREESDSFDISVPRNVTAGVYMDPVEETASNSDSTDDSVLLGNRVPATHVTVCDINQSMLDVGMARAEEAGIYSGMSWLQGNAECLPVEDNSYDAYTIAFGIRNCTHIDKVVEEAYRVLKPGGRFMCLEFSQVTNPLVRSVYDEYSFQVIPVLGQVLAADWKSYQYLVESIRQFPNQEDFKALIEACGFKAVTYENLTFGVVAIHSGFKL